MEPGEHDDELVARIGRLADKARIVGGLARLDMAHHEPAPIPWTVARRVFQLLEDFVGGLVERIDDCVGQALLQVRLIARPVTPILFALRVEPGHMTLRVGHARVFADPVAEPPNQLRDSLALLEGLLNNHGRKLHFLGNQPRGDVLLLVAKKGLGD